MIYNSLWVMSHVVEFVCLQYEVLLLSVHEKRELKLHLVTTTNKVDIMNALNKMNTEQNPKNKILVILKRVNK